MIHINLLPVRAAQKRARFQREVAVFCIALILSVVACATVYFNMKMNISEQKDLIAEYEKEINSLKKVLGEVTQFKKKQAEYQEKLDVLADLKRKKSGPIHQLDDLNRVIPEKLWLQSFEEKGGAIHIKGMAANEKTVADFITDLEKSPYYQNVDLKVTRQQTDGGYKLQSFEIDCRAEYPKAKDS